jgi:predicted Zn finger-like uncharacterized protein
MAMVTQCPHCTTAFNVTPDQLFARDGRVRCGHCREVFDGLVNLTSLEALQAGVPPPLADSADPSAAQDAMAAQAPATAPNTGFSPESWPMLPGVPEVPLPSLQPEVAAALTRAMEPAADGAADSTAAAQDDAQGAPSPVVQDVAPSPAPSRSRWPWAIAATLAALTLCGQALHTFRNEAAAHFPGIKPALEQACEWAQCTISPLQKPSALAIQASDLLIQDKAKPHIVQLIVTLQNQSAVDVAYPAIDLVLNDRFDHAVARRVFLPADYLRGDEAKKTVIGASVATTIRIDLDLGDLAAGGFGVLLIPAPQT